MDILGRGTKFFTSSRNNGLHNYPSILSGADECRKLTAASLALSLTYSLFTVYLLERRSVHLKFYDGKN